MIIGIIAHTEKAGANTLLYAITKELLRKNILYLLEKSTALLIGESSSLDEAELAKQSTILIVLGGDGTLLRVIHRLKGNICPIFGINIGSLGFLTSVSSSDYLVALDAIIDKNYNLSHRSLLKVYLFSPECSEPELLELAFNDVTISRGARSQLVRLETFINEIPITEYHADGLIISTPTGSTAYSLAAGGPILMPDSGVFVITPICPHAFSNRSLVISNTSTLSVQTLGKEEVFVSIDGRVHHLLKFRGYLVIKNSEKSIPLAILRNNTFPKVLRQKLNWRGSNI